MCTKVQVRRVGYAARLVALVALCCSVVVAAAAQPAAPNPSTAKRPRIAFVSHASVASKWWDPVKNGIAQASEDFGVDVDFLSAPDGNVDEMVKILTRISPNQYSAVVSTIPNIGKLRTALQAVTKNKKLPLVTANSGTQAESESVGAMLHVGQPEDLAGRLAGEQARKAGVKSFACITRPTDNEAQRQRCNGFAKGLGVAKPVATLSPAGKEADVEAAVAKLLEGNPQPGAILTTGLNEAHAVLAVLRKQKANARKPYFVTFDVSKDVAAGIAAGTVDFAIDQQPYLQGYLPVAVLARKLAHPNESPLVLQVGLFSEPKLHARASKYGLSLKPSNGRHILSGPAFVTRLNADKVDQYIGQYR